MVRISSMIRQHIIACSLLTGFIPSGKSLSLSQTFKALVSLSASSRVSPGAIELSTHSSIGVVWSISSLMSCPF